jgi:DNA polymerase II small subunit/DNA polymerase delta subunit B
MDTTDFEKEIEKVMDSAITKPLPRTVSTRKEETTSLSDQWGLSEKIRQELRDRLRKEKTKILTDHDTQWLALRHTYEERISDTIADMRAELAAEQRRLIEAYQEKTRELDLLSKRVEDDGYGSL